MTTTDAVTNGYRANHTLTVRVELARQLRRRRTWIAVGLVIALPLIVVAAVKLGPQQRGFGDGDLDLVGLATAGPWNFTLTMLLFSSGFLLTILGVGCLMMYEGEGSNFTLQEFMEKLNNSTTKGPKK